MKDEHEGKLDHIQEDANGVPATDGVPISPQIFCECLGIALQVFTHQAHLGCMYIHGISHNSSMHSTQETCSESS